MIAQHIQRLIRATPAEQPVRPAEQRKNEVSRSEAKDQVVLSSEARELLQLQKLVAAGVDVRADKVRELQEAIQKGTYDVPAQQIAQRMLGMWGDGSGQ